MYVSAKWKWVWNVCIVWEVRSLLKGLTGLQNQRDVIYVNDPTRECPGASLWCVNGFPALLFLCRVAATTWCGCVWGAEASGKQRWMVALAAVHPYYDRPPCRAPACLPASSDSSVGGSSAASTARPPRLESGLLLIRGFKPRRLKQCGRRDKMQVRGWWWGFWGVTGSWG